MVSYNQDRLKLKKRLDELEKRYKEKLSSEGVKEQVERLREGVQEEETLEREPEVPEVPDEREEVEEVEESEEPEETEEAEESEEPEETEEAEESEEVGEAEAEEVGEVDVGKEEKEIEGKERKKKGRSKKSKKSKKKAVKKSDELPEIPELEIAKIKPGIKKLSEAEIKKCAEKIEKIRKEIGKVIVGQDEIIDGLIMGLLCNAHVLVEGVPGIAKTLAIRALAAASGCSVKRIQFTVDMLPTDIIGITSYTPGKGFEVIKGPVFANFIIADEINRAPPKTQSALIEAMQENQVTIGRKRFVLPAPFFAMATENPIESSGVYPLPEAQIDRFLFKLLMGYPKEKEEWDIMESNITLKRFEDFKLKAVVSPKDIIKMQETVKKVYLDDNIKAYILSIVRKTRKKDFVNAEYISYGSSPRASIGLFIASKARALMQGRNFVLPEDIKKVVFDVMRHRLILSYKATIKQISPDSLIREILGSVKVK